jgi:enoyl-CoA hydratase/carnithine racemase
MFSSYYFPRFFGNSKSFSLMVNGERLLAKDAVQCGFA